jgi:hypothetical protein
MYQTFIPYICEAQHVSGDTPPIIRSLKLHWQPLVFHTWKVVGQVVGGRCQAQCVPDRVCLTRHSVCLTTSTDQPSNKLPRMLNTETGPRFDTKAPVIKSKGSEFRELHSNKQHFDHPYHTANCCVANSNLHNGAKLFLSLSCFNEAGIFECVIDLLCEHAITHTNIPLC